MKRIATIVFCVLLGTNGWAQTSETFPNPTSKPNPLPPVNAPPANLKPAPAPSDGNESKSMIIVEAIIVEGPKGASPHMDMNIKKMIDELRPTAQNSTDGKQDPLALNRVAPVASNPVNNLSPGTLVTSRIAAMFQKNSDFTVLSRPTLAMVPGSPALVSIGHEMPMEYLEQVDSETFKLRRTDPKQLGIDLTLTAAEPRMAGPEHAGKRVVTLSKIEFSLSALDGRQKIPNVSLPIGKPNVSRRTIETSLEAVEGEPISVTLPLANDKLVYLFLMVSIPAPPIPDPNSNAIRN